jgi:histidinol phosphatase-like PHP family hydrolase
MAGSSLDTNARIAAILRDYAAVQRSQQSMWGYRRAARALLDLDRPIESLRRPDGTLERITNVGPKTEPIILEVLDTGRSATVDAALAAQPRRTGAPAAEGLRERFLSRAQVAEALARRAPGTPRLKDYHGDLQMHSVWSDGHMTFEAIADACLARGYTYCAVTDHSHGLPIAGGLSMADLRKQQREIDRTNSAHAGRFRIIKGIEANILADGTLDMTAAERRTVELVLAAPHAVLRATKDQTSRMLAAVRTPGVHILAHPRGRMYDARRGVHADWDAVFAAAVEQNVAVEIDGDPSRQDLDHELARRALQAGCLFALDSDAHAVAELANAEVAIAHARLARIPRERVINCWPLDKLMAWMAER